MSEHQMPAQVAAPTVQAIELLGEHWGLGLAAFLFVVGIVGAQFWYIRYLTGESIRASGAYRTTLGEWRKKADAAIESMQAKLDRLLERSERS